MLSDYVSVHLNRMDSLFIRQGWFRDGVAGKRATGVLGEILSKLMRCKSSFLSMLSLLCNTSSILEAGGLIWLINGD